MKKIDVKCEGGELFKKESFGALKRGTRLHIADGCTAVIYKNGTAATDPLSGEIDPGKDPFDLYVANSVDAEFKFGGAAAYEDAELGKPVKLPFFGFFKAHVLSLPVLVRRVSGVGNIKTNEEIQEEVRGKAAGVVSKEIAGAVSDGSKNLLGIRECKGGIEKNARDRLLPALRDDYGIRIRSLTIENIGGLDEYIDEVAVHRERLEKARKGLDKTESGRETLSAAVTAAKETRACECGAELNSEDKFCRGCGKKIEGGN